MTRFNTWIFVALAVAFTGYLLAWIVAPSASMTLNAFDLAEWTSLHPVQHTTTPPLLVPLLLRLHLLLLLTILALISRGLLPRTVMAAAVLFVALAQLPPLEFVRQLGDANYRQQVGLAAATLVFPLLLARRSGIAHVHKALTVLSLLGVVVAIVGQQQAGALYRLSLEDGSPGIGMFVTAAAYCAIILLTVRQAAMRDSRGS